MFFTRLPDRGIVPRVVERMSPLGTYIQERLKVRGRGASARLVGESIYPN